MNLINIFNLILFYYCLCFYCIFFKRLLLLLWKGPSILYSQSNNSGETNFRMLGATFKANMQGMIGR